MFESAVLEELIPARVLLVDDNPAFLRVANSLLQRYDEVVVVGAVDRGEETVTQAQKLQPHVVLIDLEMPDQTGLEAIPNLRAMMPQVGIIALTLLDDTAYRRVVLAAGADDLVSKSALTTTLLPAIRRVTQAKML
jgi:DNA-binding NarL/FixJ family response regulator